MNKIITILSVATALILPSACGGGGEEVLSSSVVQPPGRFAFVANTQDSTVSSYAVDAQTGELRFNGYTGALIGQVAPSEVAVHPRGSWVYTANLGNAGNGANISVYTIDPDTGRLMPRIPAGTGSGPFDMLFDAAGEHAYVAAAGSNAVWSYSVHPVTGELTLLGQPVSHGFVPAALALDPAGDFLFVAYRGSAQVVTYEIDDFNGTLSTSVTPASFPGGSPVQLAIAPQGEHLYVCDEASQRVVQYEVDRVTGALDAVASRPLGGAPIGLALHPGGRWLIVARESGSLRMFGIDPTTGALDLADDEVAVGNDPVDLSFGASADLVYVTNRGSNDVSILSIDPVTGRLVAEGNMRTRSQPAGFAMTSGDTRARGAEPRFLYVANQDSDTVTSYRVDASDGALSEVPGGSVLAGLSPHSICADPLGRFVYTVNVDSPSVSAFAIDQGSGQLTPAAPPLPYTGQPRSIAVGPSGRFAFVANAVGSVEAFGIDRATGELEFRGTTPSGGQTPEAIAVDPTGQFIYVSNVGSGDVTALRFDQGFLAGGSFQIISRVTTVVNGGATAIRFAPGGERAYITLPGFADQVLPMDIDPVSGGLSVGPPGPPDGDDPYSVDLHPGGRFGFAAVRGGATDPGQILAFQVDKVTGALGDPQVYPMGMNPIDLRLDPGGRFLYAINEAGHDVSLFKVDPFSGAIELRGVFATDTRPVSLTLTGRWR